MAMADSKSDVRIHIMRSQLGRARGLGAARSGLAHWWMQRLTAIALVPLSLWFIASVLALGGASRAAMKIWVGHPINAVLLACLVIATFHHMQLGLQVVIEDYIHTERRKLAALLVMKAVTILLGLLSLIAVLRLTF
jgi:succinate dehydrogenase / fumarate reductase membrane anchor subunit